MDTDAPSNGNGAEGEIGTLSKLISQLEALFKKADSLEAQEETTMPEKERIEEMPQEEEVEAPAQKQPEPASEESAENYAEKFAALESQLEDFAAKLEAEREARAKAEEQFAESEKQRRVMALTDTVKTFAVAAEPESFAEDLFSIEQVNAELAGRMIERFRAASEAARQGGLFEQYSSAEEPVQGEPFEAAVESKRRESFSDLPHAEGWVKAFEWVKVNKPTLARDYAVKTRGG